jgi:hypothetical protein
MVSVAKADVAGSKCRLSIGLSARGLPGPLILSKPSGRSALNYLPGPVAGPFSFAFTFDN